MKFFFAVFAALAALVQTAAPAQSTSEEASAEDRTGRITLRWQIDSAQDNYGFYLNRSESPDGPWERVQAPGEVIPGVGTTSDVHNFEYIDEGLVRGRDYYYQLIEVSMTGAEADKTQGQPLRAHCRTVEEEIEHARRTALGEAIASAEIATVSPLVYSAREVDNPDTYGPDFEIISALPAGDPAALGGEWFAIFHPRSGQPLSLLASWTSWEAVPPASGILPETQLRIWEWPLADIPPSGQYRFAVGEEASAEYHADEFNSETASHGEHGEVSVYHLGGRP